LYRLSSIVWRLAKSIDNNTIGYQYLEVSSP
jgi:hypothetical protein